MRLFLLVTSTVAIALGLGGCGLFAGGDEDNVVAPAPKSAAAQPFSQPIVKPQLKLTRGAALIQPTNPDERLKAIRSGRSDPFGALISSTAGTAGNQSSGSSNANSSGGSSKKADPASAMAKSYNRFLDRVGDSLEESADDSASSPVAVGPGSSSSGHLPELPTSSSSSSEVPPLPPLPQPDLAKGIRVTGVVVIGGMPRAIIKAPDETVSRTVGPGDRLSNGQVVVKRIDNRNPDEPLVIVEQYGTEVAIGVGKLPVQLASIPTNLSPVPALWYNRHH